MPERDLVSWNTVVKIFARKGYLLEGREVFDRMPLWDDCSWQTMIGAYSEHGYASDATDLSNKMKQGDDALMHCLPGHLCEIRRPTQCKQHYVPACIKYTQARLRLSKSKFDTPAGELQGAHDQLFSFPKDILGDGFIDHLQSI
ncbi:hypothetical protein SELMODRAFT_445856 [Selaginella moellendorffii]|uniref:Pentatricopeptide repeat-containing protein n=1 Tax=Selaginella moellendorffii TaxID=88036 RepID=D8SLV0_SELML|nr:hypothetical protein SELMODRAFT_445856 [Selaginella moellendorffii]